MIIPSKHSGYRAGIRLYPGGDGGGGGSGGVDPNAGEGGVTGLGTNAGGENPAGGSGSAGFHSGPGGLFGPENTGGLSGYVGPSGPGSGGDSGGYGGDSGGGGNTVIKKPVTPTPNSASVFDPNVIDRNDPTLRAMPALPYDQLGGYYNSFLQQGYTDSAIRNALRTQGQRGGPNRPVSDSDYELLVQNAGMNTVTGRPMAGSGQFTQPVYNPSYQNYARPSTQFDTSLYGAQPMNSPAFNSGMSRGNINRSISNFSKANPNTDASNTLEFMRNSGINREDFQAYGGLNNYGPQMSMPQAQTQQPFNPYTNNSRQQYNPYQQSYQQQQYNPFSYKQPQQYNPFSYEQPQQYSPYQQSYQQQQYNPYQQSYQQQQYNPYQQSYQQQQYNPFSYQQPQQYDSYQQSYQQPQQYNSYQQSYQQPQQYNSYQQSYQQPQFQPSQPVEPTREQPGTKYSGGRSARRAEGGIVGILKK